MYIIRTDLKEPDDSNNQKQKKAHESSNLKGPTTFKRPCRHRSYASRICIKLCKWTSHHDEGSTSDAKMKPLQIRPISVRQIQRTTCFMPLVKDRHFVLLFGPRLKKLISYLKYLDRERRPMQQARELKYNRDRKAISKNDINPNNMYARAIWLVQYSIYERKQIAFCPNNWSG